jgi:putative membrane-bound dehydrogenase-like protein
MKWIDHPYTTNLQIKTRMKKLLLTFYLLGQLCLSGQPIRILFLGHESEHHNSNAFYPMLAKALGRDAIYFDYVTSVEAALGDTEYLGQFDGLLLYANHASITPNQWSNLKNYVENGGGFLPIHCASWCFANEPGFDQLVGARFAHHKGGIFAPKTLEQKIIKDLPELEAWDETYVHKNHNPEGRTILQVREVAGKDDNIEKAEPWTWIRTQGKGRVFYTASGHDERVWDNAAFHELLKKGILWAVGDQRRKRYDAFIAERPKLQYEERGNIPNYEKRPKPLPYQFPLSPEVSMQYTRVPMGFRLELFASEPDVVNPIYMQWDHKGRLWVAESPDYPNELTDDRKGNDTIKILEDTDKDGRCDKVTVFADGLNIPTSFTFANGGVIVAHAPDFLFMKDTDGDDKADVKEVLFTGFGIGDTHAGPSNLRIGLDNWVYGTVGYSRFIGEVGGEKHNFGMGVFRFRQDGSKMEFLHQFNNNTWGLGFNASGDVFGSTANNNPSFFGGLPATILGKNLKMSARMIADSPSFHPITPNIRQVDAFNAYTAGCGHALATSEAFPEEWLDKMGFVCGPTGNLLGGYQLEKQGSGYTAKNAFSIVASADEWFSPVVAEVGPDGHLWIADWYNFIIQHNPTPSKQRGGYDAQRGKGNAHINPNRDRQHGRIYRLVWNQAPLSTIQSLENASSNELLSALENTNQFWRLTAQRQILETAADTSIPALKQLLEKDSPSAAHALWLLQELNALDKETHRKALFSKNDTLKRNAIRALQLKGNDEELLFESTVLNDPNPQVRREAFIKLAQLPEEAIRTQTASLLLRKPENADDEWLSLALKAAGGTSTQSSGGLTTGPNLVPNPSFEKTSGDLPESWKVRVYSGPAGKVQHSLESRSEYVRTGKYSLRIHSDDGHDSSLHTSVELKPNSEYRLSGWVKTDNLSGARGAQYNIHEIQPEGRTNAVSGTQDWTGVQVCFNSGNKTNITLNALFGGWGRSKGTIWFDDVELVELIPIHEEKPGGVVTASLSNGKNIFHNHLAAACIRCHALDGNGGNIGPPMDGIGTRKDRAFLKESLINPSATLAKGYEKLINSPMPPMNIVLNEQEIEDVLEYLVSLKEEK